MSAVGRRLRRDADLRQARPTPRASTLTPLLALRFVMAAAMLWALVLLRRRPLGSPRGARPRRRARASAATPCRPASTSARSSASTSGSRRCCSTPTPRSSPLAAFALRRESPTRRKLGALALASSGVILVLAGGGTGSIDPLGAAMALGCAGFYTVFILGSERASAERPRRPVRRERRHRRRGRPSRSRPLFTGGVHASGEGVFWAAVIALVSTVIPIVLFTAGLARVGASTTAIASAVEPALTVALAWLVLGETLGPLQLAGGALVLSAVVLLQLRPRATMLRWRTSSRPAGWRTRVARSGSPS